ncbi:hypothetical protein [Parvularcula oceani]|uniref:hypothetical protein n=1 Tax=Parvularcula oceani TaxID=1247963 RepID=UPI0004E1BFA1|nr:hypothetical protein [Parvularcula oceani]
MTHPDDIRYQFRLNRARQKRLHDLARTAGLSPSRMAKFLCETALDQEGFEPERVARDLLVVRAGIEQLFRRSDREGELLAAIEEAEARRLTERTMVRKGGAR